MKIKFDILFEVIIEHDFFKNKTVKDIDLRPTDSTLQLLKEYGLLFKKTKKGFVILYEIDTSGLPEKPLRPIVSAEKFSFELYNNSKFFNNYTNIPLNHKGPDIFHFNNLDEKIVSSNLLLNKDSYVGDKDITRLISNIYNIHEPTVNQSTLIEVINEAGDVVISKSVLKREDYLICQLDFDKIGSGWFDIRIGGISRDKIYSDKSIYRKPVFGIIDIYTSTNVPASYRFVAANGSVSKKTYKIRFSKRNTFWKYYVILKNIDTDPTLSIIYTDPVVGTEEDVYPTAITFSKTTLTSADNEMVKKYGPGKVLLFLSSDELPLYEIPKKKISLIKPDASNDDAADDEDDMNDTVIANLPNADIAAIKPDTLNNNSFSEIFIYV